METNQIVYSKFVNQAKDQCELDAYDRNHLAGVMLANKSLKSFNSSIYKKIALYSFSFCLIIAVASLLINLITNSNFSGTVAFIFYFNIVLFTLLAAYLLIKICIKVSILYYKSHSRFIEKLSCRNPIKILVNSCIKYSGVINREIDNIVLPNISTYLINDLLSLENIGFLADLKNQNTLLRANEASSNLAVEYVKTHTKHAYKILKTLDLPSNRAIQAYYPLITATVIYSSYINEIAIASNYIKRIIKYISEDKDISSAIILLPQLIRSREVISFLKSSLDLIKPYSSDSDLHIEQKDFIKSINSLLDTDDINNVILDLKKFINILMQNSSLELEDLVWGMHDKDISLPEFAIIHEREFCSIVLDSIMIMITGEHSVALRDFGSKGLIKESGIVGINNWIRYAANTTNDVNSIIVMSRRAHVCINFIKVVFGNNYPKPELRKLFSSMMRFIISNIINLEEFGNSFISDKLIAILYESFVAKEISDEQYQAIKDIILAMCEDYIGPVDRFCNNSNILTRELECRLAIASLISSLFFRATEEITEKYFLRHLKSEVLGVYYRLFKCMLHKNRIFDRGTLLDINRMESAKSLNICRTGDAEHYIWEIKRHIEQYLKIIMNNAIFSNIYG